LPCPEFENPIEYPFAGEGAAALGYAGRQKTLDALRKYDEHVSAGEPILQCAPT
jgi:hypothetical protein